MIEATLLIPLLLSSTAVGAVLSALATIAVGRLTRSTAKEQNGTTALVAANDEWREMLTEAKADITSLRTEVATLREELVTVRVEADRAERKHATEIAELRSDLHEEQAEGDLFKAVAVAHVNALREHINRQHPPPPPPLPVGWPTS